VATLARRVPGQPLRAPAAAAAAVAAALTLGLAAPAPAGTLVRFSFEEGEADTGPDTFRVFASARGRVSLSRELRVSGASSVELRDAAGDQDFPELAGTFPRVASGTLRAGFAFLTARPSEAWNAALAGPRRFVNGKDGIAFRLEARDGVLRHHSDSIPKRLFALEAFRWYFVELVYRVGDGTYDLTVRQEGRREPLAALERQPNAASQPGSSVEVFSFTGDVEEDESEADLFVDDVALDADAAVTPPPLVAPGRRRLFVESLEGARRFLEGRPECPPVREPADLGLTPADLRAAPPAFAAAWHEGCAALARGEAEDALRLFERGQGKGPLFPLSAALALAALHRPGEAEARLREAGELRDDPRYRMALAAIGAARGDLGRAEEALRLDAADVAEGRPVLACLDDERMLAEEWYVTLLALGSHDEAGAYARRIEGRLARAGAPAAEWIERRGDAAFLAGDLETARAAYEEARRTGRGTAVLRLADVAFVSGDLAWERTLRESVYGALEGSR